MRTILLAVALLFFTASAHAAGLIMIGEWCKVHPDGMTVEHDAITGPDTRVEWWCKNGKVDRSGGPAFIDRDAGTGNVIEEAWYKDGNQDRADGPAVIWHEPSILSFIDHDAPSDNTYEAWYKDGKLSRDDGPAEIWHATGIAAFFMRYSGAASEEWWKDGKRIDPPSSVKNDDAKR
jgi:hypothetical protein